MSVFIIIHRLSFCELYEITTLYSVYRNMWDEDWPIETYPEMVCILYPIVVRVQKLKVIQVKFQDTIFGFV